MGFSYIVDTSHRSNPHDEGEGIPNPVICDSALYPSGGHRLNARLYIYLKVWWDPHTSAMGQIKDANGNFFDVLDWTAADDFPKWCRDAADAATSAFDDKLMLIPPHRYDGLDRKAPDGTMWRPSVHCHFQCMVGDARYHHCKVKVALPKPRADGITFRANSRNWVKANVGNVVYSSAVGNITQNTAAHEIGHLLGLHHIGGVAEVKDCRMIDETPLTTGNVCYASKDTDPSFANNIMGLGMQVTQYNALPWQQEICKHGNEDKWFNQLDPEEWTATTEKHQPTQVTW